MLERFIFWLLELFTERDDHPIHLGGYNILTRRGYQFKSGTTLYIDEDWS
jgi:hypothetical protein